MGLETAHVLSDERHYGAFLCAICTNLCGLDALVTTGCSHVFCKLCLETWLKRADKCPLCNMEQRNKCPELQSTQPVAYRVLSRIQVHCPLQHIHCPWKGDYGDLQAHLLSSTAHTTVADGKVQTANDDDDEIMCEDKAALAKAFKEEANAKFASNNFQEARDLYSKGIDVLGKEEDEQLLATLYANRAAAALQIQGFWECLADAQEAIRLDPTYIKAYSRRTKACLELGRFADAVNELQQGCASNPDSIILKRELQQTTTVRDKFKEALQLMETENAASAHAILSTLLRDNTKAPNVVVAAARANLLLGQTETAQRLTLSVLRRSPQFAPAYVVRGQSLCWAGDFDGGLKVIREGLRLDPDNDETKSILRRCKRMHLCLNEARQFVFHRKFEQAVEAFGQALVDLGSNSTKAPLYAILHAERAAVHLRLKEYEKALRDASRAIYARDDLEQAWLTKAKALQGLGRHEEARDELEDLLRNKWGANSEAIRKAHENADFLLRKVKRPDFYQLMGVSPIASLMEIKKQYKVKAKEYHPDKWVSGTEEQQKEAEHKFKLLGEGLEIMSDDFQRQLYDEGYDAHAIRERVAAAQQAAHRPQNYHHGHH